MAVQPPSVTAPTPGRRLRWALWAGVALVGLAAVAGLLLVGHGSGSTASSLPPASELPSATWAAGAVRAPAFRLSDENGKPVSVTAFHGRPLIVTFIDPLCHDFCPIEARRLSDLVRSLPAASRPEIVAVSVNVYGNARATLLRDGREWRVAPQWHWGVGTRAMLASVWKRYHIAVLATPKRVKGTLVHDVAHTEASYLVDANGYERALFLWPYREAAVARALRDLG